MVFIRFMKFPGSRKGYRWYVTDTIIEKFLCRNVLSYPEGGDPNSGLITTQELFNNGISIIPTIQSDSSEQLLILRDNFLNQSCFSIQ